GAGGAPEIAAMAKEVLIILKHGKKAFVEKLDFITSAGFLDGGNARERAGMPGKGPVAVITDLGILEPDPVTRELTLTSLHPGVTVEQVQAETGWRLRIANDLKQTPPPTERELVELRALHERTRQAHGTA
ncbi:MAG TPA: CoA-transferase, partial [Kiloniellales bacterium]|nr:CoA-transferase [Kiloniellales bacterium]